jgi:alcohol dehydrogenase class IV
VSFEFATATRIIFGEGTIREVPAAAAIAGRRALVVTGDSGDRAAPLIASLLEAGLSSVPVAVKGEPTVDLVRDMAARAREERCDVVIAIGGGSSIDAAKAAASMLTNFGDPLDYLEVVGRGRPIENASAPFIAVPTTAGTGSEVTRNAVLASTENGVKASLRSPYMLPRLAVIDPELTLSLPRAITASTGLDALTQLIEPYVSVRANAMTDLYCVEGIRKIAAALPRVWENPSDRDARREMSWGSLLGGLCLANAGLGAVHGFAAPVGGMFPAPHGATCAALLPHATEVNLQALRARAPASRALQRYEDIARLLTGRPHATPEDGVEWLRQLVHKLEIPPLKTYGITAVHVSELAAKAANASSMKANPIVLTGAEREAIITRAIG